MRCARKRGGSDENIASGGNAPASGIFGTDTEMVDHDGGDVLENGLEVTSSDDEEELDPRRDLRAEAVSTRHLLAHQPKNRYCIVKLVFGARCSAPLQTQCVI